MLLSPAPDSPSRLSPFTPEGLRTWIAHHRLDPLLDTLLAADARDTWAFDDTDTAFCDEVIRLHATLAKQAPGPLAADAMLSKALSDDLTYVLAYLRTSRSLQLLTAFNARIPGFADRLLTHSSAPMSSRAEGALLAQRVRHVVRHYCFLQSFSAERRAEVMAAIGAAAHSNAVVSP